MATNEDSRVRRLVQKIAESIPEGDAKLQNYLAELRRSLSVEQEEQEEQRRLLAEYEEAYRKLTSPANRVGVALSGLENQKLLIAVGDTEFVAEVDPAVGDQDISAGARVLLNDAYAVVGCLPPHPGGMVWPVAEVLEDGRLRVGTDPQNTQGRLVARGQAILDTPIKRNDEVRVEPTGRVAVEHFARREVRDYFMEQIPETPWSAIGGQEEAISLIRETIELPLLHPELYRKFDKRPVKGILLYGPPGCGKTLIGRAIAYNLAREYETRVGREVKEYFMHISGPKILNMWLGETERMVREIFDTARERAAEGKLVVVFLDEAESVLRTRSSGRWLNISNTVVPQFCAEMDGLVSLENVVLVLTSNRPDYIDPAILRPERIDRKVKVRRPNREAAKEIFGIYLHRDLPIAPELLTKHDGENECARRDLIEMATAYLWRTNKETEFVRVHLKNATSEVLHYKDLVSGALIKSVVDRAKETAIRRAIAEPEENHGLSPQDLQEAIDAEYRENEIFPKTDVMEDWLKLLDLDPDTVAEIKPIRRGDAAVRPHNPVI
jgi:proteasome-associated ATPase